MKKNSDLYKLIKAQVNQYLKEERLERLFEADSSEDDIFSDPASPQRSQKPDPNVDVKKVASTSKSPPEGSGDIPTEASLGKIIERLNTIRSGRSFKDNDILAEMTRYFNDLTTAERNALLAFLTGISQIVTAGVAGTTALEPEDPPLNIKMHQHSDEKTRKIQPVVIKKSQPAVASSTSPSDRENTAPPVPITPKKNK